MLASKREQCCTRGGSFSRVWRYSPIDEKRHEAVVRGDRPLIGDVPGEKNACRRTPAPGQHVAERDSATARIRDELRQIGSLCRPCDDPRRGEIIDSEPASMVRLRLVGIRTDDLEVRRRAESDKRVSRALAWMLPARCRLDSQQRLYAPDTR